MPLDGKLKRGYAGPSLLLFCSLYKAKCRPRDILVVFVPTFVIEMHTPPVVDAAVARADSTTAILLSSKNDMAAPISISLCARRNVGRRHFSSN